jgi:hypothetical protein
MADSRVMRGTGVTLNVGLNYIVQSKANLLGFLAI